MDLLCFFPSIPLNRHLSSIQIFQIYRGSQYKLSVSTVIASIFLLICSVYKPVV